MIRLIANISVERLQHQTSVPSPLPPSSPTVSTPTPVENRDTKGKPPPKSLGMKGSAVVEKEKEQGRRPGYIDLSELTKRLQNAYSRAPTPSIKLDVSLFSLKILNFICFLLIIR